VLAGYTFTLAGNAADEGARALAVGTAADAEAAAKSDLPGAWSDSARVGSGTADGQVTVTVALRVPVLFPGFINFPLTVTGHASAVDEETDR
jgi:pilus assembly protein CpaE